MIIMLMIATFICIFSAGFSFAEYVLQSRIRDLIWSVGFSLAGVGGIFAVIGYVLNNPV